MHPILAQGCHRVSGFPTCDPRVATGQAEDYPPFTCQASKDDPVRADATANRLRLLDATVDLVLEVGGEPTRDAIADRAGVGIGTVYRHFPDRESLLHALVRHVLETLAEVRGEDFDALAKRTSDNAARLFGLPAADVLG